MSEHKPASVDDMTQHIVTSDGVRKAPRHSAGTSNDKRRKLYASVFLLLLCIGLAGVLYAHQKRVSPTTTDVAKQVPTSHQSFSTILHALKENQPAKDASISEQTGYLDKLVGAYADVGDYQNAVATFEKRASITSTGLTYENYAYAALYYHKLGNQAKAKQAFDAAIKAVPENGDPETGYTKTTILKRLEASRKELGL